MATVATSPTLKCSLCAMSGDDNEYELVILACRHVMCVDCVNKRFETPQTDGAGQPVRGTHTSACPFCRSNSIHAITVERGFGTAHGNTIYRPLLPPQVARSNPLAGKKKGVVLDDRLYNEQWGPSHAPIQ